MTEILCSLHLPALSNLQRAGNARASMIRSMIEDSSNSIDLDISTAQEAINKDVTAIAYLGEQLNHDLVLFE